MHLFLGEANPVDVMHEQIDYLAQHAKPYVPCPPGCPDCIRLNVVQRILLTPFEERQYDANTLHAKHVRAHVRRVESTLRH